MRAVDESDAARPWAMAASSTARSRAVVVLLSPRSKAFWSSTPRSTTIESAPSARAVAWMSGAPSWATRRLVARLLLRTIINRASSRAGTRCPSSA